MNRNHSAQSAQTLGTQQRDLPPLRVAVVGAGSTGLRIAHLLSRWHSERADGRDLKITFFEVSGRAGGLIGTRRLESGLKIEAAAQGVLATRIAFLRTLEDLGLTPADVITANAKNRRQTRYVISPHGRIAALGGPLALVTSGLLSIAALFRALSEIFRAPRQQPEPNETLFQFVARRFGAQVAENLIVPLATGIWGGGAEKLLVRHAFPILPELETNHGSVIRGLLARRFSPPPALVLAEKNLRHGWPRGLLSFPQGMQTLTETFERELARWHERADASLEYRFSTPVKTIGRNTDGSIVLNGTDEFDSVFWTPAPWQCAELQWQQAEAQAEWKLWQNTPLHSLVVVNVAGHLTSLTKDGFGVLARRESTGLLGVLFVHSIYPQHVPEGQYSYRVLLGGDRQPALAAWSDEQLKNYTLSELKKLELIPDGESPQHIEIIRWNNAVGLADHGHDERQKALWRIQAYFPNIFFAGMYKKGVGVADALQSAEDAFQEWLSSAHFTPAVDHARD
ncbi:MAG: hypothetical protein RLZZ488_1876 [Pseudomonadota bacterium]|jgi:oxygen-dependent protoporphyrinogen oxidase